MSDHADVIFSCVGEQGIIAASLSSSTLRARSTIEKSCQTLRISGLFLRSRTRGMRTSRMGLPTRLGPMLPSNWWILYFRGLQTSFFLLWLLMSQRAGRYSQVMRGVPTVFRITFDGLGIHGESMDESQQGTYFYTNPCELPLSAQCDCDLG